MKTRIKHPTTKGAVYIAEAIISRMERNAAQRCGLHDILYEQFFSQEVMEFTNRLNPPEGNKFLSVVADRHPEFDAHSYLLIPETIEAISQSYNA